MSVPFAASRLHCVIVNPSHFPLMPRVMDFTTLIEPAELAERIDDSSWVVIDCRFELADPLAGRNQYDAAHLPGARYAHLDEDLSSPVTSASGRHPLPEAERFCRRLGEWGIGDQTRVAAYDDAGGALAARLWWLLRWVGHKQVAVLNGGYGGWVAAGLPTTDETPTVRSTTHSCQPDRGAWLSAEQIKQSLATGGFTLLDARAPERYQGDVEPIDPVAGHVPGAINAPFKENLDASGRFLSSAELRNRFGAKLGDSSGEQVAHMCGSGVTACHNLLAMEVAGLPSGKLYAGSWSEWCRDKSRPVAIGEES